MIDNVVTIVQSDVGDWIGMYTWDGLLYDEGHSLDWVRMLTEDDVLLNLQSTTVMEISSEVLVDKFGGSLPYNYSELLGEVK